MAGRGVDVEADAASAACPDTARVSCARCRPIGSTLGYALLDMHTDHMVTLTFMGG
jgi:hypothetical protein